MGKVYDDGMVVLDQPDEIAFFRLLQLKGALKLEIAGIRIRRNFSAYATIKRELGFKGDRARVLAQIDQLIKQKIEDKAKEKRVNGTQTHPDE